MNNKAKRLLALVAGKYGHYEAFGLADGASFPLTYKRGSKTKEIDNQGKVLFSTSSQNRSGRYLPSAYQEVEYIDANGAQYIDTGIVPAMGMGINVKCALTGDLATINDVRPLGIYVSSSTSAGRFYPFYWNRSLGVVTRIDKNNVAFSTSVAPSELLLPYELQYDWASDGAITSKITTKYGSNTKTGTSTYVHTDTMFLFNINGGGVKHDYSPMRIYSCSISKNGVLARDYIPCIRKSDNAVGMYDTVSKQFFANQGTGSFTAGPLVYRDSFVHYNVPIGFEDLYDELEYIESNGAQYIDTGVNNSSASSQKYELDFLPMPLSASSEEAYFGAQMDSNSRNLLLHVNNAIYLSLGSTSTASQPIHFATPSVKTAFEASIDYSTKKFSARIDGVDTQEYTFSGDARNNANILLFAYTYTSGPRYLSRAKVYSFRIWQDNILVRNLIPVRRKSDGAIGLFDKVENKFYANQGTGTFVAGPTIQRVEYIESTKTQYIKLDYVPDFSKSVRLKADISVSYMRRSYNDNVIGSTTSANRNLPIWFSCRDTAETGTFGWQHAIETDYISVPNVAIGYGEKHSFDVLLQPSHQEYSFDGVLKETRSDSISYNGTAWYLFTRKSRSSAETNYNFAGRIYGISIEEGSTKVHDFVPVKINNEYALLDLVERKIYRNAGTGSFTGGSVVKDDSIVGYSACITRRCGHVDLGDLDWEPISGTTITWNQRVNIATVTTVTTQGVTFTNNGNGSITANGTATGDILFSVEGSMDPSLKVPNHKYLIAGCPAGGSTDTYYVGTGFAEDDVGEGKIYTAWVEVMAAYTIIYIKSGVTVSNVVFWPQNFDLTTMFGAGNEPTTVAEFRKYFGDRYYPYDTGTQKRFATSFKGTLANSAKPISATETPSLRCDGYKTVSPQSIGGSETGVASTSEDGTKILVTDNSLAIKSDAEVKSYLAGKKCTYALDTEGKEAVSGGIVFSRVDNVESEEGPIPWR